MDREIEKLKRKNNISKSLNIILIILIILMLILGYILGYRVGKIKNYQDTVTKPEDNFGQNDNQNTTDIIIDVLQGDLEIKKDTLLNIFNNEKFNGEKIIAPGSKGEFQFCIKNKTNGDISYDITFKDEMQYKVNMKYKLKLDNVYIKGNEETYQNLESINIKEIRVPKDSINIYTLEWYWEDDDKNDTTIGEQEEKQYYKLNLEINAKEYIEQ